MDERTRTAWRRAGLDAGTMLALGVDLVPVYAAPSEGTAAAGPDRAGPDPAAPEHAPSTPAAARPSADRADAGSAPDRASRQRLLDDVQRRYEADAPHRHFPTDHTSIVFGEGDPAARLMFVGEAPGADEDRTGRPFVGRAGQLLDRMIVAMGLSRESVYIANVLKVRPPNNDTPTPEAARLCAPYLHDQIRIVSPEVIVTLGRPASQLLLNSRAPMGSLRGIWAVFPPPDDPDVPRDIGPIAVMPTFHPAFLLRQYTPENRTKVWSDLQQVMDRLGLKPPKGGGA